MNIKTLVLIFIKLILLCIMFSYYLSDDNDQNIIAIFIILIFIINLYWIYYKFVRFKKDVLYPGFILSIAVMFWYTYPMIINYFNGGFCLWGEPFQSTCNKVENIIFTLILVDLFCVFILLFDFLPLSLNLNKVINKTTFNVYYLYIIITAVMIYNVTMTGGFISILNKIMISRSLGYEASNLGNSDSFIIALLNALFVSAILLLIYQTITTWRLNSFQKNILSICFIIIPVLYLTMISGNRSTIIMFMFPLILFYLYKRNGFKSFIKMMLLLLGVFLFTQVQLQSRNQGFENLIDNGDFFTKNENFRVGISSDFFSESLNSISHFDSSILSMKQSQIYLFITYPIPRYIFNNKPIPLATKDYTLYRWGLDITKSSGNVFPGIVGQIYYNGFIFSLIEFILIICFFIWLNKIVIRKMQMDTDASIFLYFILYTVVFLSFRNFNPTLFLNYILYVLLCVCFKKQD
ncbi:O-antigen polymerase [Photobacterium phosphoreum]|uniref:O-antigen polymerase n=1 Tax=Photobacterium phosphoreum TaxID=659 RepID=UPI0024BA008E|nr:O-antigen polymerase [Photobacterium phosphoreum]